MARAGHRRAPWLSGILWRATDPLERNGCGGRRRFLFSVLEMLGSPDAPRMLGLPGCRPPRTLDSPDAPRTLPGRWADSPDSISCPRSLRRLGPFALTKGPRFRTTKRERRDISRKAAENWKDRSLSYFVERAGLTRASVDAYSTLKKARSSSEVPHEQARPWRTSPVGYLRARVLRCSACSARRPGRHARPPRSAARTRRAWARTSNARTAALAL